MSLRRAIVDSTSATKAARARSRDLSSSLEHARSPRYRTAYWKSSSAASFRTVLRGSTDVTQFNEPLVVIDVHLAPPRAKYTSKRGRVNNYGQRRNGKFFPGPGNRRGNRDVVRSEVGRRNPRPVAE